MSSRETRIPRGIQEYREEYRNAERNTGIMRDWNIVGTCPEQSVNVDNNVARGCHQENHFPQCTAQCTMYCAGMKLLTNITSSKLQK